MEGVKCSMCMEKNAKIVMRPHWRTSLIQPFIEGTCGQPKCVKEYEQALEYGFELARQEIEESIFEEIRNEQE